MGCFSPICVRSVGRGRCCLGGSVAPALSTSAGEVRIPVETNVFGPVRVVHAFTELLDASSAPVVVNVSSGVGSLAYASDPGGPAADILLRGYPSSKAALNMLTVKWARAHPRW